MNIRKARAELKRLKVVTKPPLPNGGMLIVYTDRGETRESVAARYGLDPDTEGLFFVLLDDIDAEA